MVGALLARSSWVPTLYSSRLGERGEELACQELRRLGYAILARRYRTRHGEIDIVAKDEEVLVFIEVKARSDDRFGGPLAAITATKQRKLTLMALDYLSRSHTSGVACRFDVVAVSIGQKPPRIEHVRNAFEAGPRP